MKRQFVGTGGGGYEMRMIVVTGKGRIQIDEKMMEMQQEDDMIIVMMIMMMIKD